MESDSARPQITRKEQPKIGRFVLDVNGKRFETGTAIGALAEILKEFSGSESGFMERFAEQTMRANRPLVAKNRDELYSRPNENLPKARDLGNGWWLQTGTRATTEAILEHIKIACDIARMKCEIELN